MRGCGQGRPWRSRYQYHPSGTSGRWLLDRALVRHTSRFSSEGCAECYPRARSPTTSIECVGGGRHLVLRGRDVLCPGGRVYDGQRRNVLPNEFGRNRVSTKGGGNFAVVTP